MTFKLYDGTSWNTQKSLKLYNGTWNTAVKGWVYNGSSWQIAYPEYPLNITAPTISGSSSVGSSLSTTNGTWNSDDAYNPSSYSYQWKRNSSDISGATSSSYTTTSSDSGTSITCQVTATNQRGNTSSVSSNSISVNLAAPSSMSLSDTTITPGSCTVSATGGYRSWTATWTSASNAQIYYISQQPANVGNQVYTFLTTGNSSSGSNTYGGTIQILVWATNQNGRVNVSWSAVSGATSYDVTWTGDASGSTNTSSTSTQITIPGISFGGSKTVTISVAGKNATTNGSTISQGITVNSKYTVSIGTCFVTV